MDVLVISTEIANVAPMWLLASQRRRSRSQPIGGDQRRSIPVRQAAGDLVFELVVRRAIDATLGVDDIVAIACTHSDGIRSSVNPLYVVDTCRFGNSGQDPQWLRLRWPLEQAQHVLPIDDVYLNR